MVVWPAVAWLGSVTSLVCGGVARCCLVRECDLWSVVVWPAVAWLGRVTSGPLWCGQLLG